MKVNTLIFKCKSKNTSYTKYLMTILPVQGWPYFSEDGYFDVENFSREFTYYILSKTETNITMIEMLKSLNPWIQPSSCCV